MKNTITAYQYSPETSYFIGEYEVHVNPDTPGKVHLPPNTTLLKPPVNTDPLKIVAWGGTEWVLNSLI